MFGACIVPSDGTKVAEFFDVAQCASLLGCERCDSIKVARALMHHVMLRPGTHSSSLSMTWCISVRYPDVFRKVLAAQRECL
jgi:hypothetical protein